MASFTGFDPKAVRFLQSLQKNNSREWFNNHKKNYETFLKKPAADFCEAMSAELEAHTGTAVKSKIFRIHRDVRFSKDKTPYNCHLHISFIAESDSPAPPAWFFGLETDRVFLGAGIFAFDKEQLNNYREKVAYDPASLPAVLQPLLDAGYSQSEPELKRVPSDYDKEHVNAELLRRKGLTVWRSFDGAELATDQKIVERCMQSFTELQPLVTWLATKV
jgi:uncharacterized protein (TIGR02453 family)